MRFEVNSAGLGSWGIWVVRARKESGKACVTVFREGLQKRMAGDGHMESNCGHTEFNVPV